MTSSVYGIQKEMIQMNLQRRKRLTDLENKLIVTRGRGKDGMKGQLGCLESMCALLLLSHFSRVRLCATPQMEAQQAPHPWDSPGKNTGVGCHFLLQCMKVKSEREVAQSCLTLSDPMDCSLPGSSVHGIFQAGVLEWGAIAFSKYVHTAIFKTYNNKDLSYRTWNSAQCYVAS